MYKKKSFSSKITPVNMIKSPFSCTVTNVLRNIMFWEVRNVGSTENDCTKWMNPIEIHKSKYDGGFSYNVCYYKKWYRNAEIFIKSNLQLQFVSYNPTITPRGIHVACLYWITNVSKYKKLWVWRIALGKLLMQIFDSYFNSLFCMQFYNFILYMNLCSLPHS